MSIKKWPSNVKDGGDVCRQIIYLVAGVIVSELTAFRSASSNNRETNFYRQSMQIDKSFRGTPVFLLMYFS